MSPNKKSPLKKSSPPHGKACETTDVQTKAEQHFVRGVLTRGEAVKSSPNTPATALPSGVTHEITEEKDGKIAVKRRRFSTF